jgi:hypothetical protein
MNLNFNIPHSCQTYWWTTSNFFQTIMSCIEGHVQPNHYHPIEDITQLTELFSLLSLEEQTSLVETLKNLASMANELGDNWVNPHNRYNDPILTERIQNYNQQETMFYQLVCDFVENLNNSSTVVIVTQILRRYVTSGTRFYHEFLNIFRIE